MTQHARAEWTRRAFVIDPAVGAASGNSANGSGNCVTPGTEGGQRRGDAKGAPAVDFSWLLALRWGAILGQAAIVLAVDLLAGIKLPLGPLFAVIGIEALSNVLCARWAARAVAVNDSVLGALMAFDVVLFTAILALTGGPLNPFSFLYLVYIALAAVVLRPRWGWALSAFSLACFGALFFMTDAAATHHTLNGEHAEYLHMHLQGMWLAFAVAAAFIVYFVQRVTRALAARERELSSARALTARNERLASLATLAAGAAHQLATPLSTIAVVAGELESQLVERDNNAAADDARLIREQVERCREILLQMAADAGESTGEPFVETEIGAVFDTALQALQERQRIRIEVSEPVRALTIAVPLRSVAQAVRAVVKNALEASPADAPVFVHASLDAERVQIEVRDRGHGMPADVLERVGEPFFTTKETDRGMGLGVFLARTVVERLGGRFAIESAHHHGTRVYLVLPRLLPATIDRIAGESLGASS